MKKIAILNKIFILCALIIIVFMQNSVHAISIDSIIKGSDNFITLGEQEANRGGTIDGNKLQTTSKTIYNILLSVAIVAAVIVGAVLGIKFMISSAEARAEYKEAMVPFIIGCIVAFGAFGIWKIFMTLLG